jgi:hypothetical protein
VTNKRAPRATPAPTTRSAALAAAPEPVSPFRETIKIAEGPNVDGHAHQTAAAHGIAPERRAPDPDTEVGRLAEAQDAGTLPASDRRATITAEDH